MQTATHPDRFVSVNELDPGSTIDSVVDWSLGLIRIASNGFWSVQQTAEHLAEYAEWVARIHGSGLALSLIVDLREAPPQSQAASEVLRQSLQRTHRDGDRCAIIVPQSIAKMQMRRVLPADYAFFSSPDAAEGWAMAYKHNLVTRVADPDAARARDMRA
jgi:hypothetical protein